MIIQLIKFCVAVLFHLLKRFFLFDSLIYSALNSFCIPYMKYGACRPACLDWMHGNIIGFTFHSIVMIAHDWMDNVFLSFRTHSTCNVEKYNIKEYLKIIKWNFNLRTRERIELQSKPYGQWASEYLYINLCAGGTQTIVYSNGAHRNNQRNCYFYFVCFTFMWARRFKLIEINQLNGRDDDDDGDEKNAFNEIWCSLNGQNNYNDAKAILLACAINTFSNRTLKIAYIPETPQKYLTLTLHFFLELLLLNHSLKQVSINQKQREKKTANEALPDRKRSCTHTGCVQIIIINKVILIWNWNLDKNGKN